MTEFIRKLFFGSLFLIILIISIIFSGWLYIQKYVSSPLLINQETIFSIENGVSRTQLSHLLVAEGFINHNQLLPFIMRFSRDYQSIKAGTYLLKPGMTIDQLLKLFVSGQEIRLTLQFIEGKRLDEWLTILSKAPYMKYVLAGKSEKEVAEMLGIQGIKNAEGWLYPDTYHYRPNSTDIELLTRAYHKMQAELDNVWQNRASDLPYKNAYQLLIMASIIEKETGLAEERQLVASVFINRLKKGMRLQTDPTVIYGVKDRYDGRIYRKDLQDNNPYNTYIISGLPPTPIAMPSVASLQAAAHPAKTNYLYFVATGKGGHKFSTSLQEHNSAVKSYLNELKKQKTAGPQ